MTQRGAEYLAAHLARACPDLVVGAGQKHGPDGGWPLTVYDPHTGTTLTLPDALSVRAYWQKQVGLFADDPTLAAMDAAGAAWRQQDRERAARQEMDAGNEGGIE